MGVNTSSLNITPQIRPHFVPRATYDRIIQALTCYNRPSKLFSLAPLCEHHERRNRRLLPDNGVAEHAILSCKGCIDTIIKLVTNRPQHLRTARTDNQAAYEIMKAGCPHCEWDAKYHILLSLAPETGVPTRTIIGCADCLNASAWSAKRQLDEAKKQEDERLRQMRYREEVAQAERIAQAGWNLRYHRSVIGLAKDKEIANLTKLVRELIADKDKKELSQLVIERNDVKENLAI